MIDRNDERGFALAATVLALVVVGAVLTGGFFATSSEVRIGAGVEQSTEAFYAAETGINEVIGGWQVDYKTGATVSRSVSPTADYTVRIRPLNEGLYYLESTGRVPRGGAMEPVYRRLSMVVRNRKVDFRANSALQTLGGVTLQGSPEINGENSDPVNWENCEPGDTKAGIIAPDDSVVEYQGDDIGKFVTGGDPLVGEDPTLTPETFLDFGSLDFYELTDLADLKLVGDGNTFDAVAPESADGQCLTGSDTNWGAPEDPTDPCHFYFPMIHHDGNLHINQGAGQGILLVEGDLHVDGDFDFRGIVIVTGQLEVGAGTSTIHGTILVGTNAITDDTYVINGTPTINYSACAVYRANEYNRAMARPLPLGERSWVDLSAADYGA